MVWRQYVVCCCCFQGRWRQITFDVMKTLRDRATAILPLTLLFHVVSLLRWGQSTFDRLRNCPKHWRKSLRKVHDRVSSAHCVQVNARCGKSKLQVVYRHLLRDLDKWIVPHRPVRSLGYGLYWHNILIVKLIAQFTKYIQRQTAEQEKHCLPHATTTAKQQRAKDLQLLCFSDAASATYRRESPVNKNVFLQQPSVKETLPSNRSRLRQSTFFLFITNHGSKDIYSINSRNST